MRFLDSNIRLILKDSIASKRYEFKAYMKDSDINYEIQETNLAMAPISFTNTKIHSRTLQTVKLSFGVFSEYREEAIENYDNLHSLIDSLKPSYTVINDQYLPDDKNTFGFLSVNFKGLPKISTDDDLKLHITQFSYAINKDMGYIEVPYDAVGDERYTKLYVADKMRLIPIAYDLSISGRLQLSFEETARVGTLSGNGQANRDDNIWGEQTLTPEVRAKIISIYNAVKTTPFADLSPDKQKEAVKKILNAQAYWREESIATYLNKAYGNGNDKTYSTNRDWFTKNL